MKMVAHYCKFCGKPAAGGWDVCDYHAALLIAVAFGLRKKMRQKSRS